MTWWWALAATLGYLLGSVSPAALIARLRRIDLVLQKGAVHFLRRVEIQVQGIVPAVQPDLARRHGPDILVHQVLGRIGTEGRAGNGARRIGRHAEFVAVPAVNRLRRQDGRGQQQRKARDNPGRTRHDTLRERHAAA